MIVSHVTSSEFQSTRPARGATDEPGADVGRVLVSIHAPRAGRDRSWSQRGPSGRCFNPRAPRGARLSSSSSPPSVMMFQSTRPARGATGCAVGKHLLFPVSIHAPRAGRDFGGDNSVSAPICFNPRAPRGARRVGSPDGWLWASFNPRAPRGARLSAHSRADRG